MNDMAPTENPAATNVLTLERVLSSGRRPERSVKICLRADLEADLIETIVELGTLVDHEGNVLNADAALDHPDVERAEALKSRAARLREEMANEIFTVRFRALTDDRWQAFEEAHRGSDDKPKDIREYGDELIAAAAIAPEMTVDEVKQLRTVLGSKQMDELTKAAYKACTEGGLDAPRLPRFSQISPAGAE